jgi:hypothetical protein
VPPPPVGGAAVGTGLAARPGEGDGDAGECPDGLAEERAVGLAEECAVGLAEERTEGLAVGWPLAPGSVAPAVPPD